MSEQTKEQTKHEGHLRIEFEKHEDGKTSCETNCNVSIAMLKHALMADSRLLKLVRDAVALALIEGMVTTEHDDD